MATQQFSSWVHGCAAVAEDREVTVLRQGFGATFSIPAPRFVEPYHQSQVVFHFIHIPIPTPVIMGNSGRLKLVRVLFLVNVVGNGDLRGIDLYDGKEVIRSEWDMEIEGDHTDRPIIYQGYRSDLAHVMNYGLGLTFKVRSAISGEPEPVKFFISAAGADFITL